MATVGLMSSVSISVSTSRTRLGGSRRDWPCRGTSTPRCCSRRATCFVRCVEGRSARGLAHDARDTSLKAGTRRSSVRPLPSPGSIVEVGPQDLLRRSWVPDPHAAVDRRRRRGISGLTAAYAALQRGADVTVLRIGGDRGRLPVAHRPRWAPAGRCGRRRGGSLHRRPEARGLAREARTQPGLSVPRPWLAAHHPPGSCAHPGGDPHGCSRVI